MSSHATDYAQPIYQPTAASVAKPMPAIGESLSSALTELSRDPTLARCDLMVQRLQDASKAVSRLRRQLLEGGQ